MNLYDALKISGQTLQILAELGYKTGDEQYMPMFRDYVGMSSAGHKKTYIVAVLADRYAVSERTVYNVVKRFSADCSGGAVG